MEVSTSNENNKEMQDSDDDEKADVEMECEKDSDSNDSDSENEESERQVAELQKQISKNPYLYDVHIDLIKLLKQLGELEQLRDARQRMSELFPLAEGLWLEWLKDEISLAGDDQKERKKVEDLFERAVKDYLSVKIWLEYVQFSIGGMASQDGVIKIREVFEKALSSASLHVAQGSSLWEAYREFENAILMGVMPAPGQVATKQQEDDFDVQHKRIMALFKRQLSVPLNDMEESFTEYKEWLQGEIDSQIKQQFHKALEYYKKIQPYEKDLLTKEDKKEVYTSYIDYEISHGTAARVICLYERSVQENCLEPEVWINYTQYLDSKLRDETLSIPVFERSVRNCPWCSQLWSDYLLTLERAKKSHQTVKGTVDRALSCGFAEGGSYLQIWTTYCDYLRRWIRWDEDHEEQLTLFRANIEKAVEHLYTIPDGDPTGSLRQFWASIEAKYCKNVTKGRELWNEIMTEGHGNEAAMWLNFYHFERCYGDNKHCRKLLQRALNSVSDWPESIVDAFINFEREEGDLEQYESALAKCNAQMDRIKERRKQAAEKEEGEKSKFQKGGKKQQKTFDKGHHTDKGHHSDKKQQFNKKDKNTKFDKRQNESSEKVFVKPYQKKETKHDDTSERISLDEDQKASNGLKRKAEDDQSSESVFKVPPPPGFKGQKSGPPPGYKGKKSEPPPGFKGHKAGVTEPPPGFKGKSSEGEEPPAKVQKTDEDDRLHEGQGDMGPDKSSCTAFVSNLAYDVDEDHIKDTFSQFGEIKEIRLIKNFKGRSKGYAYIEFPDELCVIEALKFDRTPLDGRPVYVSRCEDKSVRKPQFKFATELEKNKLFIKGLPFTCTKEALSNIFSQHGKLKDVRLVTYRSGAPKGLAYVEYENENEATQAVMKTDGLAIGEHTISVAISCPPDRRPQKDQFVPSLGSGKKETEVRGKARTQVSLLPRALKTAGATSSNEKSLSKSSAAATNEKPGSKEQSGKSNDDFRKMLLGNK
ncbi:squamous cell carcinoma antigen recognized by T-cells 3-like isoform X1 [Mytilus edulis]|uniref:squamous cell carcinoma antigen recognized by T-cells 3-like isoform X1 n=1 Tax=Mytilus edulis TaxID=6550 RepID=UPI0039F070B2